VRISTKLRVAFSIAACLFLAVGIAAIMIVGHLTDILTEAKSYNVPMKLVAETLDELRTSPAKTSDHLALLDNLDKWARTDFEHAQIDLAREQITRGHSVSKAADQLDKLAAFYRSETERADNQILVIHQRVVIGLIIITADIILLFVVLMALVRRWVVNPMLDIEERLARIAAGDFQSQAPPDAGKEIASLSASLDKITVQAKDLNEKLARTESLAVIGEGCSHTLHSVRSLLNSIRTLAQYEGGAKRADPNARAAFGFIIASVNKLESWVRDVLGTAHLRSPKLVPQHLEPVIRDTLSLLEPGFSEGNIEVDYRPADGLPVVALDRCLFEQALIAVLHNAIDASPHGGHIVIRTEGGTNDTVSVCVEDEGAGINNETRRLIFDPFFTTRKDAVGLGLTVARRIVELHRGSIEIESDPDKGTCMRIKIPVA
jgi:signal transduction histidine kinase